MKQEEIDMYIIIMKQYQPKLNKEKTIFEHIKTEIGRKG